MFKYKNIKLLNRDSCSVQLKLKLDSINYEKKLKNEF